MVVMLDGEGGRMEGEEVVRWEASLSVNSEERAT